MAGVHVARKSELFHLANGDAIVILPDLWLGEDNSSMKLLRSTDSSEVLYEMNAANAPVEKDRILLYGRTNPQGELYNGLRPVCYKFDSTTIKPLREVISPSIIYDTKTNIATLWWWTNFLETPEEEEGTYKYTDESSVLFHIDEETFSATDYVIRALCCAKASVNSYNIIGGKSQEETQADDGFDMSLIFSYPKIIGLRVAPIEGAPEGKGLAIVDFSGGGDDACAIPENAKDLTYSGEHIEAARPSEISWNRTTDTDFDGVNISISVGEAFHGNTLDCFKMNFLFDGCGRLVSISPEEKAIVDTPTKWADCN